MGAVRRTPKAVSNPSYVPREFTSEPHGFGKLPDLTWPPVDDSKLAQALASKIQHDQCYAIRQAIIRRYGSEGVAGYIRDSKGKVTDQFRRALRGEAVLQPRDLAYAIHHFGDDLDVSSLLAGANA